MLMIERKDRRETQEEKKKIVSLKEKYGQSFSHTKTACRQYEARVKLVIGQLVYRAIT